MAGWWGDRIRRPDWVLAGAGLGLYLALTLARWRRGEAPSLDLAIFEQAVKGYAGFAPPIVDIKGPGANQLGDHFSPILALLAPFYRVFPTPVTLLVAQCVLVALSIAPVASAARRRLGKPAGFCLGGAYLLSWGLQTGVDAQFHEYAFAVPMIAFALAAALDRRWTAAAWWAAATLTVKEDMALTVVAFGAVMAVHGWTRQRRAGAATVRAGAVGGEEPVWQREWRVGVALALAGGLAGAVIFGLVMPYFRGGGWYYWEKLDQTGGGLGLIVGILSPPVKLKTLALVSAVTLGAAWFSRWSLVAVPTLAWRFASSDPAHWGTTWHYSMILMPIMFLAAVDAVARWRASERRWARGIGHLIPPLGAAFALAAVAWFPLADLAKPATYAAPERAAQAERVLAAIEPGASVASDRGLIVRLATEHVVYWLGDYPELVRPDYVLLDPLSGWSGDPGPADAFAESVYGGDYELVEGLGQADDPSAYRLARRLP
ncbi:MAG: DUF2079 domain-containing protein [Bifidobacteriaceae bacterium]|nr:DUF2079 domain-containing protein [Bifidobacteriaceae bacterium]